MGIQIEITTDTKDLMRLLQVLARAERYEIPAVIKQSTKNIERNSKLLIRTGTRTGRHWPGLPNKSSAPGEAPKTQSGRLASSIKSTFARRATGYTEGTVGATAPHAEWLEQPWHTNPANVALFRLGNNSLLEQRPFLRPTLEKELPVMVQNIVARLM